MDTFLQWSEFKSLIGYKGKLRYQERDDYYHLCYKDSSGVIYSSILKDSGADQTEFEASYLPYANKPYEEPKNVDKRSIVHATPRKIGTYTCFLGSDDDQTDYSKVAGSTGNLLAYHHAISDATEHTIYFDLNTIENETHAHAGHMIWKDALNDLVSLETVPKISTFEASTNTNYEIYGGYLIIPAAGNGSINVTDPVLVQIPINEFGNRAGAGYWDADYNTSTHEFENISANPYGTGEYNMFAYEVILDRFINRMPLLGSGIIPLDTYDASMIGHNMRIMITLETRGTDHEWYWCGALKPYRKKTV